VTILKNYHFDRNSCHSIMIMLSKYSSADSLHLNQILYLYTRIIQTPVIIINDISGFSTILFSSDNDAFKMICTSGVFNV